MPTNSQQAPRRVAEEVVYSRFPTELRRLLREQAAAEQRSESAIIRDSFAAYMKKQQRKR